MMNHFETYFDAYNAYFTVESRHFKNTRAIWKFGVCNRVN